MPKGRQGDAFSDQAALLAGCHVDVILDVGSHVGETVLRYRKLSPSATIHCFEPVPESFDRLSARLAQDTFAKLNRLVVGDRIGPIQLHINRYAFTSSTLKPAHELGSYLDITLFEEVATHQTNSTTIDQYCKERQIEHVDVLKLDIQGAELAALRGAAEMLSRKAISLIYTELLVAPVYEGQASLGEILGLCDMHGYRLYDLYNFAYGVDGRLFQMDAILISPGLPEVGAAGSRE